MDLAEIFHPAVEINWIQRLIRQGTLKPSILNRTNGAACQTTEEAAAMCERWKAKGYRYFPACDQANSEGICPGHREP